MKAVKWIAGLILIVGCFFFNGELYQNYLDKFTEGMYYVFDYINPTTESMQKFCMLLQDAADEEDVKVFTLIKDPYSSLGTAYKIYASDGAEEQLREKYGIQEGEYTSILSGTSDVYVYDFSEWTIETADGAEYPGYYLIGDTDKIKNVGQKMISAYGSVSNVLKTDESWIALTAYGVWIIVFLLLLLLSWFDIQFDRKKDFLEISMGKPLTGEIIKKIFNDIIGFTLIFIIGYIAVEFMSYSGFMIRTMVVFYAAFLILNTGIHFTILKNDYKAIIYGANISLKLLCDCYILKAVTAVIIIFMISAAYGYVSSNIFFLQMDSRVQELEGYSFLDFKLNLEESYDEGMEQQEEEIDRFLQSKLLTGRGAIACQVGVIYREDEESIYHPVNEKGGEIYIDTEDDNSIIILEYNQKCMNFLPQRFRKQITAASGTDFYLFLPNDAAEDDYENELTKRISSLYGLENGSYSYEVHVYTGKEKVLYLKSQYEYGFTAAENPLIIYCAASDEKLISQGASRLGVSIDDEIFCLSDEEMKELTEESGMNEISGYSASETVDVGLNYIKRIILINVIITIALLILELFVVIVIVRLEYAVNAKELALKKILGYSVLNKNRMIFLIDLVTVAGGTMVNMIFATAHNWFTVLLPPVCGCLILVMELIIIFYNICNCENKRAVKTLKGGSL